MSRARRSLTAAALSSLSLLILSPSSALACACGCGVFDVGDGTLVPNNSGSGFTGWFRFSYMDQNQNLEGSHRAPAADNRDKSLETAFYTFGGEYMINRRWTLMAELPLYDRTLVTTDDGGVSGPPGSLYKGRVTDIGDLEVSALYTGFSPDLSTGLSFGLKLPTGNDHGPVGPLGGTEIDRDSLPGTGSTDLMIGGYHIGAVPWINRLSYFIQARLQVAVSTQGGYRPGNELDTVTGVTYDAGPVGPLAKVAPSLQLINSLRAHDTGIAADPPNSGYERLLIAPGVRVKLNRKVDLYADVEIPLYQHANSAPGGGVSDTAGQLVAPVLIKMQLNYAF